MNHIELHKDMSDAFKKLKAGQYKPQLAKEIFNGAGKIINNAKTEIEAIKMGFIVEVPLLEITTDDVKKSRKS